MKIAVLTDAHGNLPALQVALRAIRREGTDAIFHTGDAIGIGPFPAECLELLLSTPRMNLIRGNHDSYFSTGLPERMSDGELKHQQWVHSCLDPSLRSTVREWPYLIQGVYEGVRISFLHYGLTESQIDFTSIIRNPRPIDLDKVFADIKSDLVFYGHDHSPSDLVGTARYVNPGSLGCHAEPIARFAILECENRSYELKMRQVPYDDSALFQQFERHDVPDRHFIYKAFFGGRNEPSRPGPDVL